MRTDRRRLSMVDKALAIIEVLYHAKRPLRILELSEKLSIPRSTVYRLLEPLESSGYVRRVGGDTRYQLSLKFLQIGEMVRDSLEIRRVAYPFMVKLRDQVDLAVHLVVRDGNEAVYVEKVESRRPVRLFTQIGRRAPLHVTACPRVLLAYCDDEEIHRYVQTTTMVKYTENTVADPDTLWQKIGEIRAKGYSVAFGELEPETAAIAVPVFNHRKEVVASLSIAGPEWYFKREDTDQLVSALRSCAEAISREIGHTGDFDRSSPVGGVETDEKVKP